jgi:hypothetical protein
VNILGLTDARFNDKEYLNRTTMEGNLIYLVLLLPEPPKAIDVLFSGLLVLIVPT